MTYTEKCNQKCYLYTHITVAFNFLLCVTQQWVLGIMLAFRHSFPLSACACVLWVQCLPFLSGCSADLNHLQLVEQSGRLLNVGADTQSLPDLCVRWVHNSFCVSVQTFPCLPEACELYTSECVCALETHNTFAATQGP